MRIYIYSERGQVGSFEVDDSKPRFDHEHKLADDLLLCELLRAAPDGVVQRFWPTSGVTLTYLWADRNLSASEGCAGETGVDSRPGRLERLKRRYGRMGQSIPTAPAGTESTDIDLEHAELADPRGSMTAMRNPRARQDF